jgi:hypothetical protein
MSKQPLRTVRVKPAEITATDLPKAALDRDTFWDQHRNLKRIRKAAVRRGLNEWAVLGAVLARISVRIPHDVVLPGDGSVNYFAILAGAPGTGKSRAQSTASELVPLPEGVPTRPLSSGEGVVAVYSRNVSESYEDPDDLTRDGKPKSKTRRKMLRVNHAAFFSVDEIGKLSAKASSESSTLLENLRSGWSGQFIGGFTQKDEGQTEAQAGTYSMGVVINSQLDNAGFILDDGNAGTPQRFVWLPAKSSRPRLTMEDAAGLSTEELRERAELDAESIVSLDIRFPEYDEATFDYETLRPVELREIRLCDSALREELYQIVVERTETGYGDHEFLLREKTAYLLSVLTGSNEEVTDLGWDLSGVVMEVSRETLAMLRAESEKARVGRLTEEGKDSAARNTAMSDALSEEKDKRLVRAEEAVARALERAEGGMTRGALRRNGISSSLRDYLDKALANVIDDGTVEVVGNVYVLASALDADDAGLPDYVREAS